MKLSGLKTFIAASVLAAASSCLADIRADRPILGDGLPPGTAVLTRDDGPDVNGRTQEMARELYRRGIPTTFMLGTCHFDGQYTDNPLSSMCIGYGAEPPSLIEQLEKMGHTVGNHTHSHVKLTSLSANEILRDVRQAQDFIGRYQHDGLNLFRCPGLACGAREAKIINSDEELRKLTGFLDVDVGSWLQFPNGEYGGGDWYCFRQGIDAKTCSDLYVQDIRSRSKNHGVVILLHDRTEDMVGSNYPLELVSHILDQLEGDIIFVRPDAIPGVLGGRRIEEPKLLTIEFGDNDGSGDVEYGNIGRGKTTGACRKREDGFWCALFDDIKFEQTSLWLPFNERTRSIARYWLADVTGDGLDDLVFQTQEGGIWVAASNGSGFDAPFPAFEYPLNGNNGQDYHIAFGDTRGSGKKDLIIWANPGFYVASFNGKKFQPIPWGYNPIDRVPEPLSIISGRIDNDGREDVCAIWRRGLRCYLSTGSGFDAGHDMTAPTSEFFRSGKWVERSHNSFSIANINGKTNLIGGIPTGIVYANLNEGFSEDGNPPQFGGERYIENTFFTDMTGWEGRKIRYVPLNGRPAVCGRGQTGLHCGYIEDAANGIK